MNKATTPETNAIPNRGTLHDYLVAVLAKCRELETQRDEARKSRDAAVALNIQYDRTRREGRLFAKNAQEQRDDWKDEAMALETRLAACEPWALFYRDGKTLGEIAEQCGGTIYDYSPWLAAPLVNAAFGKDERAEAALNELTARLSRAEGALRAVTSRLQNICSAKYAGDTPAHIAAEIEAAQQALGTGGGE